MRQHWALSTALGATALIFSSAPLHANPQDIVSIGGTSLSILRQRSTSPRSQVPMGLTSAPRAVALMPGRAGRPAPSRTLYWGRGRCRIF